MRIGFLGPFSSRANADYGSERQTGAIEQQIFGVGQELAKLGHEVYICRNWEGWAREDVVEGVHLVNLKLFAATGLGFTDSAFPFGRISQAHYVLFAPTRLRTLELDVLIAPGVIPAFVASITFGVPEIPKVFVANNNDMFVHQGRGHSSIPRSTKAMMHAINRRYDAAVALTRSGQEYLQSRGIDCGTVIPNAVDPEKYRCEPDEGFILTAARLVPHKRIEDLLHAFSAVRNEIPERLVIIGSGPRETFIESLVRTLGIQERVRLQPFLPRTIYKQWLSRCSFFVLPSEAEAFGVTIIEAMASGKPVIARNTIGPRDIITSGHDGFLFHDRSELEQQIMILSRDRNLRIRLGKNARETVEAKFTFKNAAMAYESLLDSLFSRQNRTEGLEWPGKNGRRPN